ncbi:transposase [Marinitoga sp. 1154]|uniref:IS1182 family transposase n=1 Tax=Marinitoga sp. 1154 TaxID=1643335 RepID=UPI001586CA19|nr:IS1182 family transposase [Marinitoga sp. 1154]NUU98986.1 transposase [Marinitoga sp. 1154]
MITKRKRDARRQIEMVAIEDLVPEDHLVRKIEAAINFDFIYKLVEDKYSQDNGRPSIDPVVLIKIVLIQYIFGIRSMRQTIKEIETNVAYRWFLGYGLHEKIPHFSTFGKNYERRFRGTDIFEKIFKHILEEAIKNNLINAEEIFIDATHVKANANKKKYIKKIIEKETKSYKAKLEAEINEDRKKHGKKPLKPKKEEPKKKETKESTTDPESGMLNKQGKEKMFAYSYHAASDRNGFVLGVKVTGANIHDSEMFEEVLEEAIKNTNKKPKAVAIDAGYKKGFIIKSIFEKGIIPVVPYTRPIGRKGMMNKRKFKYDKERDVYICPQGEKLKYVTTTREGYKEYKSDRLICEMCPLLDKCTSSKDKIKKIARHIWEDEIEKADKIRLSEYGKEVYSRRKETIERVFADLKEKHSMRWTTLRGKEKVSIEALLVFAAMNLKKMAIWLWRNRKGTSNFSKKLQNFLLALQKIKKIFSILYFKDKKYLSA